MKKVLPSGMIACAMGLLYWCIALNSTESSFLGVENLGNIKCYFLFLIITGFMFLVSYLLFKTVNIKKTFSDNWKRLIFVGEVILMGLLIYPIMLGTWVFPFGITFAVQATFLLIIYLLIRDSGESISNMIPKILILICGLFAGLAVATPNTFAATIYGSYFNIYHTSAYIDSIYNVVHGIGYVGDLTNQYGHYALFFYIPMKIFGCSTRNIAIFIGIIGAATFILGMSGFCMIVKNRVIQIFTIIACAFYVMYDQMPCIYWQTHPHRLFFPAVTLFLIAYFSTGKLTIGKYMVSIIVMTAAMVWNTESGIICSAAVGVWWFTRYLQECTINLKKIGFSIIIMLSVPVLAIIFAIGIVDIYNIMCGARTALGFSSFLGSMIDTEYVNGLETPLRWGNDIYIHKMIVFLICLCWGTANSILDRNSDIKNYAKSNYAVAVSIIGLGMFTYYINRTMAGHSLVNYCFVFALGLLISGGTDIIMSKISIKRLEVYDITKLIICVYAILMMNSVILSSSDLYNLFNIRYNTLAYNYENFTSFCEEIAEVVPQDIWAAGSGTSAIYMQLGWDNKIKTFINPDVQEVNDQSEIFVYFEGYHEAFDNFELVQEFEYNGCKYAYFIKKTGY